MINISYMGTKKNLAHTIAAVIEKTRGDNFLDLFSGMCAVGEALAGKKQVWNNDILLFPCLISYLLFNSSCRPPDPTSIENSFYDFYYNNYNCLYNRFEHKLNEEAFALASMELSNNISYLSKYSNDYFLNGQEINQLGNNRHDFPYRLFSLTYADSYFGMQQCVEIDSIVFSLDKMIDNGTIDQDQKGWLLIALAVAMQKTANTTGHFAQYLEPKESNSKRYIQQRKRSIRIEWLNQIYELAPIGTTGWRKRNRSFNMDAFQLLDSLKETKQKPNVIYADPPYTNDQYSRFYHLFETLVLYDYPSTVAKGRYRSARYQSDFSLKAKAVKAFEELAYKCKSLKANLVVSYPDRGLIHKSGANPLLLLNKYYPKVEVCHSIPYKHSTFGASKGASQQSVTEIIYWAKI